VSSPLPPARDIYRETTVAALKVAVFYRYPPDLLGGDDLSGKGKAESTVSADLALYPDLSAMQLDKLLGQG
jgi:hypothetical protein